MATCSVLSFCVVQAGGAGRPFYVGLARCSQCNGIVSFWYTFVVRMLNMQSPDTVLQGEVPCPMCAGRERSMTSVSRPDDGSADQASTVDPSDLTWLDEL